MSTRKKQQFADVLRSTRVKKSPGRPKKVCETVGTSTFQSV